MLRCPNCGYESMGEVRVSRETREAVHSRAKGRCESCGKTEARFHLHHRDSNSLNNALANLAFLCPPCHMRAHREMKKRESQDDEERWLESDARKRLVREAEENRLRIPARILRGFQ